MNIYLCSDTHFGHEFIKTLGIRPHNYEQLFWNSWHSVVQPEDTVIHLGDLAFTGNTPMGEMIKRMPGNKILVRGNHDQGHDKYYKMGFNFVCDKLELNYRGQNIIFTHAPVSALVSSINIHGHLHGDHHRLQGELEWYKEFGGIKNGWIDMAPEIWGYKVISLNEVLKKYHKSSS